MTVIKDSQIKPTRPIDAKRVRPLRAILLHRVEAALLLLVVFGIIGGGVFYWATGTPQWGIVMAPGGPTPCQHISATCQNTWTILSAASTSADTNGIQAGMVICQYDSHPVLDTTTAPMLNQASQLTLSSDGCAHTTMVNIGANVSLTLALIDFTIALICGTLAVLIVQHATDRHLILHVTALLLTLALGFGWLPLGVVQPILGEVEVVTATFLSPALLATLIWRLLLPVPSSRPRRMLRSSEFALLLGCSCLLSLSLVGSSLLHLDAVYIATRLSGNITAIIAILITLAIVGFCNITGRVTINRDYARVLGGGVLVAIIPILVFGLLPTLFSIHSLIIDGATASVTFLALPLALAYVVLKSELLGVDSFVRITVERILGIVFFLFVVAIVISITATLLNIGSTTAVELIIPVLLLAVLFTPIQATARHLTEFWLFPQIRHFRQILATSTSKVTIETPEDIADAIIGEIQLALPVRRAALFVGDKDLMRYLQVIPNSLSPLERQAAGDIAVPRNHPYLLTLTRGEVFTREELGTPRPMPRTGPYQDLHQPDVLTSWQLFVPLVLRDQLVGVVVLGPRTDGLEYSRTDKSVLLLLVRRRALSLDYARILADLRAALQQQQAQEQQKDIFLQTAHHELRTPLTAVIGYLEILRDVLPADFAMDGEDLRYYVDQALVSGQNLTDQLNMMVEVDKMALNQPSTHSEWLDIDQLIAQVVEEVSHSTEKKNHTIQVRTMPLKVWADARQVWMILRNLLVNALKYSPDSAPVYVIALPNNESPDYIDVAVRDYGAGIRPEDQRQIFEKGVRLERDINSPIRGSGLGLFLAKSLIEAMGGSIWVESTGIPGEGSSFHFTLPRTTSAQGPLKPTTRLTIPEKLDLQMRHA